MGARHVGPDDSSVVRPVVATSRVAPSRVRFRLFGPFEVTTSSRTIGVADFPSRKAKQVCELLACAAGRAISKDQLVDALWGDKLPQNPGATVDHAVSLLRATVVAADGTQPISTERGRYRIDLHVGEIDVVQFDELVDQASGEPGDLSLSHLLDAVELARGSVLEDEMYAPWAAEVRERYRRRVQRVRLDLARSALARDDPLLALTMAERARLDSDVVIEEGFALNISALIRIGRRHDARVLMAELEERMRDEFDADLAPETQMLQAILRSGRPRPRMPVEIPVATQLTEPIDALSFVGRDDEVDLIRDAVGRIQQGANEMIVVQGPPGIGKSRLLAEVKPDPRTDVVVRYFTCLPTDAGHPLFVAHRLIRKLEHQSGHPRRPPPGDSVAEVYHRLADLVDPVPTMLAIDDLQWADDDSLAVLAGLARPHAVRSILILATRRPPDAGEPDDRCDLTLSRSRAIQLGLLDRRVVDGLPLEGAWVETGGHPGLLVACLEAARLGGRLDVGAVTSVLDWIGPSGSIGRVVLGHAAELGRQFRLDLLAAQLGLTPTTTRTLLDDLQGRTLVRGAGADVFEFTADLTRRVLLETGAPDRLFG